MPEGKKAAVPAPKPVREEDLYSAKTHLHQPVPVQETATVSATAQLADAPEGALPSEVRPEIVTWEKLCEAIKASGRSYNMEMIEKAYDLANTAHKGVCRRSGEPYICHPLAVARLVLDLGMDSESIAAALLHDVVEDTPTTLDDLKAAFGEEVALLVDGVTKLTKIQFSNIEELQAENLRKMLLAMSRDVRVMIIKLCDRLHNMRTGDAWPEQKRRDKARETMEVYAPIANRLGILNVKEELEDRSLHYLDPVGYEEISRMLSERAGEEFLAKVSGVIERRLAESGIEGATIKRRVKSIYGIYRKTIMQNKSFDEIYDIYAVRVILDTLAECYSTLGLIHDMYHPLPNRFKDYISTPKPNGYQSLHTTVIGHEGIPFEVQIRTRKMDEQAEYGVAAHWKYKEGLDGHDKLDERLAWVSQLLENQRVSEDSGNLLHDLKSDLLPEEVFAFTPKGDVINLPTGATCIDFAYAIHSAVGNRMVGCKVNNRMVPIDHIVSTGEIIEVILGPADKGPSRDWLKIVRTSEAKTKETVSVSVEIPGVFRDVSADDWFFNAVYDAYGRGLMVGESSDLFAPNDSMTRAMLITTLYRMSGSPAVTGENPYSDVPAGSYYEKAVIWAMQKGVANGMGGGKFEPDTRVTRQQAVTMLYRYAVKIAGIRTDERAELGRFTDSAKINAYAITAMRWAVGSGLMKGYPDNTLQPNGTLTRAEAATLLVWLAAKI